MQSPVLAPPATTEDALMELVMALGRRFRVRTGDDTVDPSQAALLHTLSCRGPLRLGDVAEAMALDASTVSRHVQQLGERGLIERDLDPEDARARIVAISDAGREALKHSFDQRRAFLTTALDGWSDADRDRLRHDLTRLTTQLGESS